MIDWSMMVNQKYDKQKKHITTNGKYFISTNDTFDNGWETMVFGRNPVTDEIDWMELDCNRYDDEISAYNGHNTMIEKWEAKS